MQSKLLIFIVPTISALQSQNNPWVRQATTDPMTDKREVSYSLAGTALDGSARRSKFSFTCSNQEFVSASYDTDKSIAGEQDPTVPAIKNYYLRIRLGQEPAMSEMVSVDRTGHRIDFPARIVRDFSLHGTVTFQFLGVDGVTYTDRFYSDGLQGGQIAADCGSRLLGS